MPAALPLAQRWLAIAALGAVGVFGSENLFWSAPPAPLTLPDLLLTWLAYSLAAAAALIALTTTRARGWLGVFLAGCIYGWLIEGVVVQTVYDAFPYTLVFTGMSWHALLTALLLGLGIRVSVQWPLLRQFALLLTSGLAYGLWALYWPLERSPLPDGATVLIYLCGLGVVVPLANLLLDRLPPPHFTRWETGLVAALFVLAWVIQFITAPDLARLAVPGTIAVTLWLMRRLRHDAAFTFGATPPGRQWRHLLFLFVPAIVSAMAIAFWPLGGIESNWIIAIGTSLLALLLYAAAVVSALRRR
jgi:hypothetical protein